MRKTLYAYCDEKKDDRLLTQWDSEQNGTLSPHDITYGSHKKIWWKCEMGHRWQAVVYTRTGSGSGCPYCSGRRIFANSRTLATEYPELCKQWHPTRNGELTSKDVMPGTHKKVWWRCEKGHEWEAQVNARVRGSGCPYCSNRKILVGENDLATTHPHLAGQWHPTKNAPLTPQMVVAGNCRKIWWKGVCGHEWQASLSSRTANQVGCPICAGKQVIPGENDLESQFPQIATEWHPYKNGDMIAKGVTAYSNRRVWWRCELGHEYQAVVAQRVRRTSGCPYCAGRKVLVGFNDLGTVQPKIAAQWHPTLNGGLAPQMVTKNSHQKVWWQCSEGHTWKTLVYVRTGTQKCGCPICAGKVKKRAHPGCLRCN